ncbi:MAG: transglycosylase domain-containing protein [Aquabacterium sp.]
MPSFLRALGRLLALVLLCTASLQIFFVLRLAAMNLVDPQSTAFQRSEAWRLLTERGRLPWRQDWVDASAISVQLKRAVIASEDAGFTEHVGIEWDALREAWDKNRRATAQAERRNEQAKRGAGNVALKRRHEPKLVGGSTISQQLAKNLFLSGERTLPRKAQEAFLTLALELVLTKQRVLEIYLNSVEWGEGVFGAQAAAQHYFRVDAARLDSPQAARLAVLLPAPKRYERQPWSAYVSGRAATITARMPAVDLP